MMFFSNTSNIILLHSYCVNIIQSVSYFTAFLYVSEELLQKSDPLRYPQHTLYQLLRCLAKSQDTFLELLLECTQRR